jgi:autotransporter-associated beta strand protein
MKPCFNPFRRPVSFVASLALFAVPALAAPLYWDGNDTTANADGGSGIWDLTTTNWDTLASGGSNIDWTNFGNTDIANFGGTGGTVTFGTNLGATGAYPNSINVTAGNYIFDLNSFSLSSRGSNLTISSGATLAIQNGTYQLQTNHSFTVNGTNALAVSAKITGAFDLQKSGGGDLTLTNDTSDFTGRFAAQNGGTVSFSSIKNSGVASSVGAGSVFDTGINNIMAYTGTGDSTNRTFGVFGGGSDTLKNNGSGALVWTGAFTNTKSGASTLTFGGTNVLDNDFQGALINSTAGGHILSVTKADAGAWKLSGNSSFTGATSVTAGTLIVGHANALGSTVGSTSVTGASQLILTGGIAVGAEALTLNSSAGSTWNSQTGAALRNYSGTNSWAGTIALGQNTSIATNSGSALTVSGAISGGFNLTKADSGTLTLSGANTYTGTTTISAGTLQADRADVAAVSGALGNGGTISFTGGTLRYTANSAGTNYSTRIVNSTTAAIKLDTNGQNVTFGSALSSSNTAGLTKEGAGQLELKMSAASYTGTTTINGGTLKFAGTADLDFLSSSSININNGASLVIYSDFNRTTLSNGKTFTFGNTGGGSIVYDKGNHLWQSSTGKFVTTGGTQNTISGANGGFINPQNANTVNFDVADGTDAVDLLVSVAIGSGNYTKSGAGTLSITSFSTLGGGGVSQPNLTINAGTFDVGGTARLTTVGQSTGVVTSDILNNGVYRHSSSNPQTLAGIMSGNGALTQNGSGTLILSGANTYTGQTTISAGSLQIGAGSITGKLSTSSAIVNNSNLTINRSNAVTQGTDFSSAAITGTGSFTAAGVGTTTLNAANSYSGGTTVNAGADLRINGAQTGGGTVTVAATGKLGGSGSVIGGINVSGVLAPGNSIESFGVGTLSFSAGSTYAYELSTLGLNGDLAYSSGTLGIASGTILTLTDLGASTAVANGSKLTLISSVGAWNGGLFSYDAGAGLATLADDSNITLGANIWKINYNDTLAGSNFTSDTTGATNFVTLTVVPEPNAAALLGGLGTLLLLRRRR